MRVAQVNMVNFGSTGTIARQLAAAVRENGGDSRFYYTRVATKHYQRLPEPPQGEYRYGSFLGNNIHFLLARLTGKNCCYSRHSTKKLLRDLEQFQPDIVHLHNLHASYLNFPMLFSWLKKSGVKVVWTFHDCWPMTAKCPHFDLCGCDYWKSGCHDCRQLSQYPASVLDRTQKMWKKRRAWFTQLENLVIVSPSHWLAELAKQSYFADTPIRVIHTGIDLAAFRPAQEDCFKELHEKGKYIILGVANPWSEKKGLDVFLELSRRLDDRFRIVLVGNNSHAGTLLPDNIISIPATQKPTELAEIYSSADVFANPTREETLGLVNAEALACGTPVVTFRSGGSPEVPDESCGVSVARDDIDAFIQQIVRICTTKPYSEEACRKRAEHFDAGARYADYLDVYRTLLAPPQ